MTEMTARAGAGLYLVRRARTLAGPNQARWVASALLLLLVVDLVRLYAGMAAAGTMPGPAAMVAEVTSYLAMLLALWRPLPGALFALVPLALSLAAQPTGMEMLLLAVVSACVTASAAKREAIAVTAVAAGYVLLRRVSAPDADALVAVALLGALLVGSGTGVTLRVLRARRDRTPAGQEAERVETARIRRDERRILAAELHDVVAHQLSNAKLQVMGHRASDDPRRLHTALDRVEQATGSALTELRLLVRVLRDDPSTSAREQEVEELGERLRPTQVAAGAAQTLIEHSLEPEIELPAEADHLEMTVQRTIGRVIVQGVANMCANAPPGSRCVIRLVVNDTQVVLRLANPLPSGGDPPAGWGWGWGLRSLAERVDLTGGRFSAGPVGADWVLTAILPHE